MAAIPDTAVTVSDPESQSESTELVSSGAPEASGDAGGVGGRKTRVKASGEGAGGEPQLTPMMAQYRRIKGELPRDALLLFRLGDFYEMFFEDAQSGAQILNVALTRRGVVPMCGIPFHAANGYVGKLLKAGYKVAICDQVEEARPGQLVRREVTQILSPGTHFDERMLAAERNNFVAAVNPGRGVLGLALVDLTTGDFRVTEVETVGQLLAELDRVRPAEIILPAEAESLAKEVRVVFPVLGAHEDWVFAPETAVFALKEHFKVAGLDGFGLAGRFAAIGAAGGLLHYLVQHLRRQVQHLTRLVFYANTDHLVLDSVSLRNLEVVEPLRPEAPRASSLCGALDRTVTPMGARRIRDWLARPLAQVEGIRWRQDAVQAWMDWPDALEAFRQGLREVRDLERTISRLSVNAGNGRDLVVLRQALEQLPGLRVQVARAGSSPLRGLDRVPSLLGELNGRVSEEPGVVDLIGRAIADEPPLALKEGGIIRDGYSPELDELRRAGREGKDWVARLQQEEMQRTGIASLKIRFNSVFGYYIEVTKSNLDRVPPDYIRKQTVANGERFITPGLKEMESKILGAEERSVKLEYDLFLQVREQVLLRLRSIQESASALAQLDVLASFAETARVQGHVRPEVGDEGVLSVVEGRHPVLDAVVTGDRFVPNDTDLSAAERQIMLITGPNMAGKSTYIRQVALLALMAHTGAYVPATKARVDLLDRIFTRIGASDDLARGQSTFMVEMSETANILNNATSRSLVILDEIGRGTSTFDGLSLAWSIVEHLHNQVGAKTLFATHYHELTELAGRLPRLQNFNVAVREWKDAIIFLRKIVAGGTDKSYGIHVARLAGVPQEVVGRAREILRNLEDSELTPEGNVRASSSRQRDRERLKKLEAAPQLDLFGG